MTTIYTFRPPELSVLAFNDLGLDGVANCEAPQSLLFSDSTDPPTEVASIAEDANAFSDDPEVTQSDEDTGSDCATAYLYRSRYRRIPKRSPGFSEPVIPKWQILDCWRSLRLLLLLSLWRLPSLRSSF
jgi:hypothetical protein